MSLLLLLPLPSLLLIIHTNNDSCSFLYAYDFLTATFILYSSSWILWKIYISFVKSLIPSSIKKFYVHTKLLRFMDFLFSKSDKMESRILFCQILCTDSYQEKFVYRERI